MRFSQLISDAMGKPINTAIDRDEYADTEDE